MFQSMLYKNNRDFKTMSARDIFLNVSLLWTVLAFFLLLLSWRLAGLGMRQRHRQLMMFLTLAAWVFIGVYLWQSSQPRPLLEISENFILWLAFHGTLGLIALLGATALVVARLWQERHPDSHLYLNRHHKLYGLIFISLWLFTHIGGVINYILFI